MNIMRKASLRMEFNEKRETEYLGFITSAKREDATRKLFEKEQEN